MAITIGPDCLVSSKMRLIAVFTFLSSSLFAQTAPAPLKALNSYADYANQSADEVASVVTSIMQYYPSIGVKIRLPHYVCPLQQDEYYFNEAVKQNKLLGATGFPSAARAFQELKAAADKIDEKCKALDTYHKLEDYKQDNFARAETLILDLQLLIKEYSFKQKSMQAELEKTYKRITSATPNNAYRQADTEMLKAITKEKAVIDAWAFNLKQDIHTGWPAEKLQQSIPETDIQLAALMKSTPALQYPASTMWTQFQSSLTTILDSKRRGLDKYNFESKKSDKHSNDFYLELINYFNGTLVSDYNTFLKFSERDGYFGLKTIKYVPVFEIRTEAEKTEVEAKPFKDISHTSPPVTDQKIAINKTIASALSNYVEFINETWRQTRNMQLSLNSFNSSAAYFKKLESFERRAPMYFDYKDFQLSLSYYQKTISSSSSLPPLQAKTLNDQCEVLLNILKEMDNLSASLETEVKERKYEQDHLNKVYSILERQAVLFNLWDEKKEILYQDVRSIYNSFPSNASNSWHTSGKVLRELTDINHDALFQAKAYYRGDTTIIVNTDKIDHVLREVLAKEYDNMKGIQKIGRNNGLCPYTPYEDLPETSRQLSAQLKNLKPAGSVYGHRHPYHSLVYLYNEIVDDYNKFCELSTTVFHLPAIRQPELFEVQYPDTKTSTQTKNSTFQEQSQLQEKTNSSQTNRYGPPIKATDKTSVIHDTVFIEKRDTIYLKEPDEEFRSMEGYATNNLVLLLDVSGSMNQPEKLPLLKQSVLDILSIMRQEDRITIITFSGKPKIVLKNTSFKESEKIKSAVSDLTSSGKTDGNAGLKLAYKIADENYIRGGNNRIILATDGEYSISKETSSLIEDFAQHDIFLSIFNFGRGTNSSKTLQNLARLGKGNYEVISKENVEMKLIREAKGKLKR